MDTTHTTPLEPGNRIQLPADWAEALGLRSQVSLAKTAEGILVRPCPAIDWDGFFAAKLIISTTPANENEENFEVTGDDLLF